MDFIPFPLNLLSQLATPPIGDTPRGLQLLPLMRWLNGHLAWRQVAVIQPYLMPTDSVVELAINAVTNCKRLDAEEIGNLTAGSTDLIYVTAEAAVEDLAHSLEIALPRLAVGGVIVVDGLADTRAVGFSGTSLPIGDGVVLLRPTAERCDLTDWLDALSQEEIGELGRLFQSLGATLTSRAELSTLRAMSDVHRMALKREQRSQARLKNLVEYARAGEHFQYTKSLEARAACDSLRASISWKVTAPLRFTTERVKQAFRRTTTSSEIKPINALPATNDHRENQLWDFLTSGQTLALPQADKPSISIIVDLSDSAAVAFGCLRSIAENLSSAAIEVVIIVSDPDEPMRRLLRRLRGARVAPGLTINDALNLTVGDSILLLDTGAEPGQGSLQTALSTLISSPSIGAVSVKVVGLNGLVVHPAKVLQSDGSLLGIAAGLQADTPEVQYRHAVETCSSFLLIRSKALREAGGLNPAFAKSLYAIPDLCLRLAASGWSIVYEPCASVTIQPYLPLTGEHAHSVASLFATRHASSLARAVAAVDTPPLYSLCKRVLLIDDRVPYPELGAGYPRASRVIHELHRAGWCVTFYPNDDSEGEWETVYEQFPREVEFMLGYGRARLADFLAERGGFYDTIMVSRPHNMRDYLAARPKAGRPPRLVYDAEAVFATREFLRLELAGHPVDPDMKRSILREELGLADAADIVTAVNSAEAAIFQGAGLANVFVLGLGVEPHPVAGGFSGRRDLLFVGALDEDNAPNADGIKWFVRSIMPKLDQRIGQDYRLLVAGRCRASSVRALASSRVQILGMVDDLTDLYATARVFVAPTRFAAGLPLKVQEAVGRGLPVVSTALLAKQLGWQAEQEILFSENAEDFADCCARLYRDPALWHRLRRHGLARLINDLRGNDFVETLRLAVGEPAGKQPGWWVADSISV